jgi:hypothetical protein
MFCGYFGAAYIYRRSSIILDMREAISESGKRLSSMVAENQTRALASLLQDLHGRQLTTRRKVNQHLGLGTTSNVVKKSVQYVLCLYEINNMHCRVP